MSVIGHGVDLVEIERIERMLEDHGDRFLERCFVESEIAWADQGPAVRSERIAARFAAKEAVLKALGTGLRDGIDWKDITVTRNDLGAPGVLLTGRAAEIAAESGITDWRLSLSHAGGLAMASVLALGGPS
jgi:holo-[acyl-carrier protein] synthase